jgi:hypothetical protein
MTRDAVPATRAHIASLNSEIQSQFHVPNRHHLHAR